MTETETFDWDWPASEADRFFAMLNGAADEFAEADGFAPRHKLNGSWCEDHLDECYRGCPKRRSGIYGAAGVLFVHRESGRFLLNQRAMFISHPGTWSVVGGALDKGEEPVAGAMREATEEMGVEIPEHRLVAVVKDESVKGWTYTTAVVEVEDMFNAGAGDSESIGNGWFTLNEMVGLPLHPVFKRSLPELIKAWYYREDRII